MKKNVKTVSIYVSMIFILFLAWILISINMNQEILFPGPIKVFSKVFLIIKDQSNIIFSTFFRLIIAVLISFIMGIITGIIAGRFKNFSTFLAPLVLVIRVVPIISISIIILVLFGMKAAPYVITFLLVFPITHQNVKVGINSINKELIDVYDLEDNNILKKSIYCYLPLSKSFVISSLVQSFGLGLKVLVMGEYLAQTPLSIGNALYLEKINLNYDKVFAWTIIIIFMALVLEIIIKVSDYFLNKDKLD